MKTLVVYYSLTGQNRKVAELLAKELGADLEEIVPVKPLEMKNPPSVMFSVMNAWIGRLPELKGMGKNSSDYDLLVLGAPIWLGGQLSTPFRSYLAKYKGSFPGKIAFFMSCGLFREKEVPGKIERICGKKLAASLILGEKEDMLTGAYEKKVKEFASSLKRL